MKLCKKSYKNECKQVVLVGNDLGLVRGGTNGNGLDPTDDKTKPKAATNPIPTKGVATPITKGSGG